MPHSPENLISKTGLSAEKREEFKHTLRVTVLGGSIENQDVVNIETYKELGKIPSQKGVVLSTGPILENTFINEVASQFIEEEKK